MLELEAQLDKNNVTLELEPDARAWIAERGYDAKMGARPMSRVIQEHIKRPLAEELLFGSLADGGHVRITVGDDDQLELNAYPMRRPHMGKGAVASPSLLPEPSALVKSNSYSEIFNPAVTASSTLSE